MESGNLGLDGHCWPQGDQLGSRYFITGMGVAFSHDGNYLYITQMFEGRTSRTRR